ncbi:hypothetical protein ACFRAE_08790 [Sphingobacterium sp. HJSM2_6]|uniref:hypothetical protein n=1 Tax=Sphingobacterium sp. HJSM2_6 TaxID=3366264 RepID=UPI003BC16A0A
METRNSLPADIAQLLTRLQTHSYNILVEDNAMNSAFTILICNNELLIRIKLPNGHYLLQRPLSNFFVVAKDLEKIEIKKHPFSTYRIKIQTQFGVFQLYFSFIVEDTGVFLLETELKLVVKRAINWKNPNRDIIICTSNYTDPACPTLQLDQNNARTGACFTDFGKGKRGCLFYLQDLGALFPYTEVTESSLRDCVKIEWPQLGFILPSVISALKIQKSYLLNKSFIIYQPHKPKNSIQANSLYIKSLHILYPKLIKPKIKEFNLIEYTEKSLQDLFDHKGCWKQVEKWSYLNAYINNYNTPPESMVQTAILKPLYQYQQQFRCSEASKIIEHLSSNLSTFYDESLGIIHRWLPSESYLLNFDEEHKQAFIMDSWYLHYPLLQLAYLFENGLEDPRLRKQFEKSLIYLRNIARNFDYQWPIFFHIFTLKVIKGEGNPGIYGQKDVAGLYMLIMLKSYKLSYRKKDLNEAIRVANSVKKVALESLYQSNNTAYMAEALLELYSLRSDSTYLRAAEICLGNIIRNCAIWYMHYGNAKERSSFFSLFPLKESSYAAAFEEHETLASFHRIMHILYQHKIKLDLTLVFFLNEYIQYALARLPYYFPPLIPSEIIADQCKSGYVNPTLWIPLEDLGDGWEAVGQIGQEIYGAGLFFNLCNYHVIKLESDSHAICSLPFILKNTNKPQIKVLGAENQEGILWLNNKNKNKILVEINKKPVLLTSSCAIKSNDIIKFFTK